MASERRILVVGATRILRPAVNELARGGDVVLAVARHRSDLTALEQEAGARIRPVPLDVRSPGDVTTALERGELASGVDAAIIYPPDGAQGTLLRLLTRVRGPVVMLKTSAEGAGDGDPLELAWHTGPRRPHTAHVLLGWTDNPARWHSPAEISTVAIDALDTGRDAVLGRVRPWHERPGRPPVAQEPRAARGSGS